MLPLNGKVESSQVFRHAASSIEKHPQQNNDYAKNKDKNVSDYILREHI